MPLTCHQDSNKAEMLASLRKEIMRIEGFKTGPSAKTLRFGIDEIDGHFPMGSGLPMGATHEFCAFGLHEVAAAVDFIAALISKADQTHGAIVWIERTQTLYPLGLAAFGLDASRLIFVHARREKDVLCLLEEALRTEGLVAVVGEVERANLDDTRRLQLAVEKSGNIGFLLRCLKQPTDITSACVSRWRVKHAPSEDKDGLPGLGETRWHVALEKIRHGQPREWQVEWVDRQFSLVKPKIIEHQQIKPQELKRVWR